MIEPLHVGNGTLKSRLIQRGPFEDGREFVELLRDEAHMAPIWTVSATNPIATIAVSLSPSQLLLQEFCSFKLQLIKCGGKLKA